MDSTILYSYAAVCDYCKKCYLSIKDGRMTYCPKCNASLAFRKLQHRILVSKEGRKVVSHITEKVAGSGVFNKQLPLKGSFKETTELLLEHNLD